MHIFTGWDVVCVNSPSKGSIHRLVVTPSGGDGPFESGRYVDVDGYVSEDDLRKRYKARKLDFQRGAHLLGPTIIGDEELRCVMSVAAHLDKPHFNLREFQEKLRSWIGSVKHFDEPREPRPSSGQRP